MKKLKYITIFFIIIIVAICAIILSIKTQEEKDNVENVQPSQENIKEEKSIKEVTNSIMFFSIESCIDQYMEYLSQQNNEAVYAVLDNKYKEDNNITLNNVLNKLNIKEKKNLDYDIQKMLVNGDGENIQTYYVYGVTREKEGNKKESYITVKVDIENNLFTIMPYVEKGVFNE